MRKRVVASSIWSFFWLFTPCAATAVHYLHVERSVSGLFRVHGEFRRFAQHEAVGLESATVTIYLRTKYDIIITISTSKGLDSLPQWRLIRTKNYYNLNGLFSLLFVNNVGHFNTTCLIAIDDIFKYFLLWKVLLRDNIDEFFSINFLTKLFSCLYTQL